MVFLGSLIAAVAVEKSNLHMRIALKVILMFGTSVERFLLGFMTTTAILSMCISNIATAALVMPMINAAFEQLTRPLIYSSEYQDHHLLRVTVDSSSKNPMQKIPRSQRKYSFLLPEDVTRLRRGILLGNCYASIIAGTATLTGNPTNLMLNAFLHE